MYGYIGYLIMLVIGYTSATSVICYDQSMNEHAARMCTFMTSNVKTMNITYRGYDDLNDFDGFADVYKIIRKANKNMNIHKIKYMCIGEIYNFGITEKMVRCVCFSDYCNDNIGESNSVNKILENIMQ